ncbi:CpaF family protein [uncultured Amnibacterium sp.]|uniref:CpaF family protein n=1 Tax=uncultured Amnibacterium sp. TaxID=1631851 RepID=UPI0035CB6D30
MTVAVQRFVPERPELGEHESSLGPPDDRSHSVADEFGGPGVPGVPGVLGVLGRLGPFLGAAGTTDLLLDGRGMLWRDDGTGMHPVDGGPRFDVTAARALAVELIASGGRHLDDATPFADVRLPGGLRVHAVLPPVSTGGAVVSIRVARSSPWRLDDLVRSGMLGTDQAAALRRVVDDRQNVLVCGPAGSGKTSLLAALLAETRADERVITVEDVAELAVEHPHVVGMEARQANADGAGGVDLGRLIREALRMRPDRLVLGECRGAEIADLLTALNTGHSGGGTLHCTSLSRVPARLQALGALAGMTPEAVRAQAVAAIDVVIQLERRGTRRIAGLGRLVEEDGRLHAVPMSW